MADSPPLELEVEQAVDVARGHVYSFLAAAFSDPAGRHFDGAMDRARQTVAVAAAALLAGEAPPDFQLGPGERSPGEIELDVVVEELRMPREYLIGEHRRIFGLLIGKSAPPNETEYRRSTDAFFRAQELADINGFYRAFGLERDPRERERPDHIALELEFMGRLIEKELAAAKSGHAPLREKAPLCQDAQRKFFAAHLGWWAPAFAGLMRQAAASGLYAAHADALAAFIASERAFFGWGRR